MHARRLVAVSSSLFIGLCWIVLAEVAHATVLSPGDTGSPDVFSGIDFTEAQSTAAASSTQSTSGLSNVSLHTAVYADPNNPFGAGDLDFLYQITNGRSDVDSNDTISLVTMSSFTGFSTDVGYGNFQWTLCFGSPELCAGFNPDQGYAPSSVYRSASGDIIGFNDAIGQYFPASEILVIETNATSYSDGSVTVTGPNGSLTFAAFQPAAAAVPEPSTWLLFAVGSAVMLRRKRAKSDADTPVRSAGT
jgi:PEP-CTERM motif-containing protein